MASDFQTELQVLENCKPLSRVSSTQGDWLLASTRRNKGNVGMLDHEEKQLSSSFQPEEEAVSQGISHVESASTSPAAQVQLHACSRSSDTTNIVGGKKTTAAATAARNCSPTPGEDLEGTLITLEVSSSSMATEDVMPSTSRVQTNHVKTILLSNVKRKTSSEGGSVGGRKRKELRPLKTGFITTITDVNDSGEESVCRDSVHLSKFIVKQSLSLSTTHRGSSGAGQRRRRLVVLKNNSNTPSAPPSASVITDNTLKNRTGCNITMQSASGVGSAREASVATGKTKESATFSLGNVEEFKLHQICPDVIVSSESEGEEMPSSTVPIPYCATYRKREVQASTQNGSNAVPPWNSSNVSASASASVAVIDVVEVTEPKADQSFENTVNNGRNTLSHRLQSDNFISEDFEVLKANAASVSACDDESDGEVISFSEMKRVSREMEEDRGRDVPSIEDVQHDAIKEVATVERREVAEKEVRNKRENETEQLRWKELKPCESVATRGESQADEKKEKDTLIAQEVNTPQQEAVRISFTTPSVISAAPYVKQTPKAKCCTVM